MRIWDIQPSLLCRQHLLGEHRELHALWTVITQDKKGYSQHPETKRWVGKLKALYNRHEALVEEMEKRGYRHGTPLDATKATDLDQQDQFIHTIEEQMEILRKKGCECSV